MAHDGPWMLGRHSTVNFHGFGGWGVFLFFAISGFLVCTRILQDEASTGRFRIGGFYARRIFRIQPAATVYVAAIALLSALGLAHQRTSSLFGALFMYQNYLFNSADTSGSWFLTGHFWTLAVEEHFYLLLSLVLFTFHRYRTAVFSILVAGIYIWQRFVIHFSLYNPYTSGRRTDWMLDYLFVPALFAVLLRHKPVVEFAKQYLQPWIVFCGTAMLKLITEWIDPVSAYERQSRTLVMAHHPILWLYGCGFWVVATVLHPHSLTTRLLEWKPIRFIGRLSYSLYLWHVLFFVMDNSSIGIHAPWLLFLGSRPWRYVATLVFALASYYGVEKPFIRLGHRLAPPATPGHADLGAANTSSATRLQR